MAFLQLRHKTRNQTGFSLLEVMIAVTILAVGLLALAGLMSQSNISTNQSRYMSTEALLASEKIEDLNRYGSSDANVAPGGSVTADTTGYFDQIYVSTGSDSSSNGDILETTTGTNALGNPVYTTVRHSPNGTAISQTSNGTPPAATADMAVFDRRWLIEQDKPVKGVRRITVFINLTNFSQGGRATFQMSTVRP